MSNPLYRSLYWRIALGFILCIAGVLTVQSVIVLALLNRTDVAVENLTQAASATLAEAMSTEPQRDLQQYLTERYPRPSPSFLAVLTTGQVLTAARKRAPDRVVEAALREFEEACRFNTARLARAVSASASRFRGDRGAVSRAGDVGRTSGPALLATGVACLVGTTLSSVFIFGPAHRRLKELESAALRLGSGDMAVRARDDGGDEVARVALAFNQMAAALAASDRARRLLLADVSHELMTPLTAVRGYQTAGRDPDPRRAFSLAISTVIGDETLRVERIVKPPDLAKLEAARPLRMQDVSVEGLFRRIAAGMCRRPPPGADLRVDRWARKSVRRPVPPGAGLAESRRQRIRYAARGGRVELRAELNGSGTVLAITADGPGIAPEHLAFVFDRFYKADSARTGDSGGSGLGLSIVRAIVERHGGTVNVSSEPGEGTTFTIWLPASGPS
jgi:signal transduction histidine kinase